MSDELAESPPSPEPAKGLDAIIDSAIEASETPEDSTPEVTETITDDNGRVRDKSGKFVSTKTDDEPSKEPAPEGQPEQHQEVQPGEIQPLEPHPRWSEAEKADFAKLPPEGQKFLLESYRRQEAAYTQKTQEFSEQRKQVEPLLDTVTRLSDFWEKERISPQSALEQSAQIHYTLKYGTPEQKQQMIANIAQFAGVQMGGGQTQPSQDEWVDPAVAQLLQRVQTLDSKLHQFETQAQLDQTERAKQEFTAWGQTKDVNGQLRYPHFERVQKSMIQMVANGLADTWDDAYDKAVWGGDKELRSQMIEDERKRALAAETTRRQEAVENAKKAQPVKTSPSGKGQVKATGLDAIIDKAISAHS